MYILPHIVAVALLGGAICCQAAIEPHGTQSRTLIYLGYMLAKLDAQPNKNVAENTPSPTRLFIPGSSQSPIVTAPSGSPPNQGTFPLEVVPPTASVGSSARDLPSPTGPVAPSAEGTFPLEVIPPTAGVESSGPRNLPPPIGPVAPSAEGTFPPTNQLPATTEETLLTVGTRDLPPSDTEPLPPSLLDSVRPLTLSPDTASFPPFELDESSSLTSVSSGWQPERSPLAQSFPQTIPLPDVALPPPSGPTGLGGTTQCACVPAGSCITRTSGGVVDVRIVTQNPGGVCGAGQQYCCSNAGLPNLPQQDSCGLPNIIQGVFPLSSQANLGEFPWSGIILNGGNQYLGGAVLITASHVLTAAHLVIAYGNGAGLKIRLGDWDLSGTYEPVAFAERAVAAIAVHPNYTPVTLQNDLAVVTLASPVSVLVAPNLHINTACLPSPNTVFTGAACQVAGWGRDAWNGNYQNIIKKVDVSIMGNSECQSRLRTTKLGANWNLDTISFICAGGDAAKDSCTGDGGNALVCMSNGRYVVAGITAGGVECGLPGIPALYVNTISYINWINQMTLPAFPPPPGNIDPRRGG